MTESSPSHLDDTCLPTALAQLEADMGGVGDDVTCVKRVTTKYTTHGGERGSVFKHTTHTHFRLELEHDNRR